MIKSNAPDYVRHAKKKPQMLTHIRIFFCQQPFYYGDTPVQCGHPGCANSDGVGDVQ